MYLIKGYMVLPHGMQALVWTDSLEKLDELLYVKVHICPDLYKNLFSIFESIEC